MSDQSKLLRTQILNEILMLSLTEQMWKPRAAVQEQDLITYHNHLFSNTY